MSPKALHSAFGHMIVLKAVVHPPTSKGAVVKGEVVKGEGVVNNGQVRLSADQVSWGISPLHEECHLQVDEPRTG